MLIFHTEELHGIQNRCSRFLKLFKNICLFCQLDCWKIFSILLHQVPRTKYSLFCAFDARKPNHFNSISIKIQTIFGFSFNYFFIWQSIHLDIPMIYLLSCVIMSWQCIFLYLLYSILPISLSIVIIGSQWLFSEYFV